MADAVKHSYARVWPCVFQSRCTCGHHIPKGRKGKGKAANGADIALKYVNGMDLDPEIKALLKDKLQERAAKASPAARVAEEARRTAAHSNGRIEQALKAGHQFHTRSPKCSAKPGTRRRPNPPATGGSQKGA